MSATIRKILLVAVLMLVASAYCYEQFVIKRRTARLHNELLKLADDTTHTYSEEVICQLVGRPAETIYDSKQKRVIKFTWPGLTWKSYDLFVEFRKFRGSTLITDASLVEPAPNKPLIEREKYAEANQADAQSSPLLINGSGANDSESSGGSNGG